MSHDVTAICVEHRDNKGTTLTFSIRIFCRAVLKNNTEKVVLLRFDLFHIMIKLFIFIKHDNMRFNNNTINIQSGFES